MKKIIGIVVITATIFCSAINVKNSNSDVSLTSLIAINTANAEGTTTVSCVDVENPGSGGLRSRICVGCYYDNHYAGTNGKCTISY